MDKRGLVVVGLGCVLVITGRQSAARASAESGEILGFEAATDWSTTTAGAVLGASSTHTEGAFSLAVQPAGNNGWTPINSLPLSAFTVVSSSLAVDVMLPTQQANPYWLGAVQMYLTLPSRNIYSAYLGQVELTGKPIGVWNTLTFPLTNDQISTLLAPGYSDLTFTLVINVQTPAGTYLVDNGRFMPVAAGDCTGRPNGTLCSDGNACTTDDTCQAGVCTSGAPVVCASANSCLTGGTCDPGTGACSGGQPVVNWTPCDDGDLCNHGKSCHGGVCGGGQTNCDDGDYCTADACAPDGTCTHTELSAGACTAVLATTASVPIQPRVDFVNQTDNNRCVPDPAHIINRLNSNGELLAWQYKSAGYTALDSDHFHTETIVRMPYQAGTALDGSVFVSDWSHVACDNPGIDGNCGAHLGAAKLGYKGGRNGKLLATNRAYVAAPDWQTAPNPGDGFMAIGSPPTPHFNMSLSNPIENHPGGASALGSYVVTGIQDFLENCTADGQLAGLLGIEGGGCNPDVSRGIPQVWDFSNPLNPILRSSFVTWEDFVAVGNAEQGKDAVAVAITKLNNGRFLLAMNSNSPTPQIEFYVSQGNYLADPLLFANDLLDGPNGRFPDAVVPVKSPSSLNDLRAGPPNWQSFNFITGCDGSLWILGMRDDGAYPGPDAVDSYQVLLTPQTASTCALGHNYCVSLVNAVDVQTFEDSDFAVLNSEGSKVMNCNDNSGNQQCSLAAGGGAYVDPDGQVIIYGTAFDEDEASPICNPIQTDCDDTGCHETDEFFSVAGNSPGSNTFACLPGSLYGKEFHERHGNSATNTSCPTMDQAWVEFYSGTNFNDLGDDGSQQVFYQDYVSRLQRDPYFGRNDFAGKAHSVRWCLPTGSTYQIFSGNLGGSYGYLNGTGAVTEISDLGNPVLTYPYGGGGHVSGNIGSGEFFGNSTGNPGFPGTPDNTR